MKIYHPFTGTEIPMVTTNMITPKGGKMSEKKPRVIWIACDRKTKQPVRCTSMSVYALNQEPPKDAWTIFPHEEYIKFVEAK